MLKPSEYTLPEDEGVRIGDTVTVDAVVYRITAIDGMKIIMVPNAAEEGIYDESAEPYPIGTNQLVPGLMEQFKTALKRRRKTC